MFSSVGVVVALVVMFWAVRNMSMMRRVNPISNRLVWREGVITSYRPILFRTFTANLNVAVHVLYTTTRTSRAEKMIIACSDAHGKFLAPLYIDSTCFFLRSRASSSLFMKTLLLFDGLTSKQR